MKQMKARDFMSSEVVTVRDDMSVRELAAMLERLEISGAPVEDHRGRLVGVVSVTDIAAAASRDAAFAPDHSSPDFFVHGWEEKANPDELRQLHIEDEGLLVGDIVTPVIYSVAADDSVSKVAQAMVSGHVHRVLVTDQDRLVGIISTLDILRLVVEEAGSEEPPGRKRA